MVSSTTNTQLGLNKLQLDHDLKKERTGESSIRDSFRLAIHCQRKKLRVKCGRHGLWLFYGARMHSKASKLVQYHTSSWT